MSDGFDRSSPSFTDFTPARKISEYSSIDAWPTDSTKRSRFGQFGSSGLYRSSWFHST